ncbi:hypothetical protein [Psychroserpens mesophilus]|uniref:hypothetical protein n=1 Tax=Psychroserpens mesophilus TaxID=325473 RepID=UPI003D662415
MRKITLLTFLIMSYCSVAQILNESANWPNNSWVITSSYDPNPNVYQNEYLRIQSRIKSLLSNNLIDFK